jgi:uncharacterized protein YukE
MMADYIKVNASRMRNDIEEMHKLLGSISGQIDLLEESMIQLETMWQGDAWNAYQIQMRKDIEYLRELFRSGISFEESFREAKDLYQNADLKMNDEVMVLEQI